MEQMLILVGLLGGLLLLGYVAVRWGVDSTDGVDSPEWDRRRSWRVGFPRRNAADRDLPDLYAAPLPVLKREIPPRTEVSTPARERPAAA